MGVSDNFWRHVCRYFRVIDAQYIRAHVQRVYLASEPPWVVVLCLWQVIPHDGYRDMFAIVLKPVAFPCGSPGSPIHDLVLLASAGMTCTCVVFFFHLTLSFVSCLCKFDWSVGPFRGVSMCIDGFHRVCSHICAIVNASSGMPPFPLDMSDQPPRPFVASMSRLPCRHLLASLFALIAFLHLLNRCFVPRLSHIQFLRTRA